MTALLILAAGASTRLGYPKQNLLFKNKTLLQRAIETALKSNCRPVFVVLGANAEVIKPVVQPKDVTIIYNPDWNEGMASSIRIAIREIEKDELISEAIIMLCDQPFVSFRLINLMLQKQLDSRKPIVACAYNNTTGVPVLFNKSLFAELLLLQGDEGAKNILKDHHQDVEIIPFIKGNFDIDTMNDYDRLIDLSN